jgi:hypothetical protein
MRNKFFLAASCAALAVCAVPTFAAVPTAGLWAGEIVLDRVNEVTVGINSQNIPQAPDPLVATPVKSAAHLRIVLHVDAAGQVRLLKNVALVDKSTNNTPDLALITDESLYGNFPSGGKRLSAVAFDFGDNNANDLLERIATVAAQTAASNGNALTAANALAAKADVQASYTAFVGGSSFRTATLKAALVAKIGAITVVTNAAGSLAAANTAVATDSLVIGIRNTANSLAAAALFPDARYVGAVDAISQAAAQAAADTAGAGLTNLVGINATNAALLALTNALNATPIVSAGYTAFIGGSSFASAAALAASAASNAVVQAVATGALGDLIQNRAQSAALKALTDANVFKTADKVVNTEVLCSGALAPGGTVEGTIYLGANHPTNPFMHRRHTDHTTGYNITRLVRIQVDAANSTNGLALAGFGVERLTGSYREELFGLHKPLGPNLDHGLLTEGHVNLERLSTVSVLNQ